MTHSKTGESNILPTPTTKRKIDIIFNTTLICQWDCDVCCVDAVHVTKKQSHAVMRSNGLTRIDLLPISSGKQSVFEIAHQQRIRDGKELPLEGKKAIIDNLDGLHARIDISGGDALLLESNFDLLKYASLRLGRANVSLTATGAGSAKYDAETLGPLIDEYNFTFDASSEADVKNRPKGYAQGNLKKAESFVLRGVKTRAELPLTKQILSKEHLSRIYKTLHDSGIGKLLVMRLFPVGRGILLPNEIPSRQQYTDAIRTLQELEAQYKTPVLKLQCALKHLIPAYNGPTGNPCDVVTESFGLMATELYSRHPGQLIKMARPCIMRGYLAISHQIQCLIFLLQRKHLSLSVERMKIRVIAKYSHS